MGGRLFQQRGRHWWFLSEEGGSAQKSQPERCDLGSRKPLGAPDRAEITVVEHNPFDRRS
jgi:hypothetical protein